MSRELANALAGTLPASMPGLFNPYTERCPFDGPHNGPEQRIERLAQHLSRDPALLLVGEAPGYAGCRYTGVAFTSERLLMAGAIPRIATVRHRLSTRDLPFSEPSATVVWSALHQLGIAETTILWNAVQLHPFKEGDPWTNRTPRTDEIALGRDALLILRQSFPAARIVAVGDKAARALKALRIQIDAAIRHPAHGGATDFRAGLSAVTRAAQ
jgi:uracil-DNA glycosylase